MGTYIPLESISIAEPCKADWNRMRGDDQARFCGTCQKNVYNLSEMSKAQAEALLLEKEGKLCIRYYRRADGTIITDNCPVGFKATRRPVKWLVAAVGALAAWGSAMAGSHANDEVFMGEIAAEPQPTPKPSPTPVPPPVFEDGPVPEMGIVGFDMPAAHIAPEK